MKTEFKNQNGIKVTISEKKSKHLVDLEKITHLCCDGDMTTFHFIDEEKTISVSKLLKKWEAELVDYGFVRVNYDTIININFVIHYIGGKERKVTLVSNIEIIVSHRRKSMLYNILKKNNINAQKATSI